MSAVCDCLFNVFAATLRIGGHSSIRNLRTRHAVLTGTHFSWSLLPLSIKIPVTRSLAALSTVWFSISVVRICHYYFVMTETHFVPETISLLLRICSAGSQRKLYSIQPYLFSLTVAFCKPSVILAQVRLLYACSVRNSLENQDSASLGGLDVGDRTSAGTCCPLYNRQEAALLPIMTVERTTLLGSDWHLSSLLGNSSF